MKNYLKPGDVIPVTAPYAVSSGGLVLVGSIVGVATHDAAQNATVEVATKGVFTLAKTSALEIAVGALVYLDDTNHCVNKTASAQKLVGVAVSAAADPSATVNVRLNGAFTS